MTSVELEEYQTADGALPFSEWLDGLRDGMARVRIARRLTRLQAGLLGDWKPVGGGVIELREDYGPGYRVYCARHGSTLIVLLAGGDKRTQQKDLERAQGYWQDWKQRGAP
jgi:putative addiction module killer protein